MSLSRLKSPPLPRQSARTEVVRFVQFSVPPLAASSTWADLQATVAKIKPSIVAVGTFMAARPQQKQPAAFAGYPMLNALGLYPATHRGHLSSDDTGRIGTRAGAEHDQAPEQTVQGVSTRRDGPSAR